MALGPVQILIVALVILVLFGRGRISEMMGDFGKGVKSFRKGLGEDEVVSPRLEGPQYETKPAAQAAADPRPADKTAG